MCCPILCPTLHSWTCLQILTWSPTACSSMVSLNSLPSEIAIALFYFPASKGPKTTKARCSSSRWDQVGCPDSLHLPSPGQQSNAIKISLFFPLSPNLACGPQIIAIINPFRKWTVERARREERGEETAHELIVRKSGGHSVEGRTVLASYSWHGGQEYGLW